MSGAGIGGGCRGTGSDITISGDAQVKAQGGTEYNEGAGAGIVNGGTRGKNEAGKKVPVDGAEVEPDTSGLTENGRLEYYAPGADMEKDYPEKVIENKPEMGAQPGASAPVYSVTDKDGNAVSYTAAREGGVLTIRVDAAYAREILAYVFTRQARNFGVHSRYIDGTLLEPGFELDELCAPVLALEGYLVRTGERVLLQEPCVKSGLFRILSVLETKRHPEIELYETFLQPTDDEIVYPYLTYDNALVWRVLLLLSEWLERPDLARRAGGVKAAVYRYCVREGQFVWSTDLEGHYDIYDEPPGSLQLLPHYGFCAMDDPVWQSTVRAIRSEAYPLSFAHRPIAEIGCRHAPHPWVLSICNSLLCGHADTALAHLARTRMDNGLACESVNEDTGECETGAAFATCAGFLAYALWSAAR